MKKKYDEDKLAKTFMPAVIRRYRDAAGLSQQELADRGGISKLHILFGAWLSSAEFESACEDCSDIGGESGQNGR